MRFFQVGGAVRDRFLGQDPKDIDFAVEAPSFAALVGRLETDGFTIWQVREEFLTVRAQVPEHLREEFGTRDADFVMCRADGTYSDGRRPDEVFAGTIFDDLARRDFTVNAIAMDTVTKEIIDPHKGRADIQKMRLRTVGAIEDRFTEDALRALRAIRFIITRGFEPDRDLMAALRWGEWLPPLVATVAIERVSDEVGQIFRDNVSDALDHFVWLTSPELRDAIFRDGLWLMPSLKG